MKVGIPREVKNHEYRVAITPAGVHEFIRNGHEVFVERSAGVGLAHPGRRIRRRRRDDPGHRGRRVGQPPTWSSRSRSRSPRSTTGCARGRCCSPTCTWPRPSECTDALARPQGHRHRVRDGASWRTVAAAARPDVRGGRPARAAGGRVPPDALRRRPGRADGRRARRRTRPRSSSSAPACPA